MSETIKVVSTAYVTVSMEICTSGSNWGGDCTIGQIDKQARDQADGFLRKLKRDNPHEIMSVKIDTVRYISHERK